MAFTCGCIIHVAPLKSRGGVVYDDIDEDIYVYSIVCYDPCHPTLLCSIVIFNIDHSEIFPPRYRWWWRGRYWWWWWFHQYDDDGGEGRIHLPSTLTKPTTPLGGNVNNHYWGRNTKTERSLNFRPASYWLRSSAGQHAQHFYNWKLCVDAGNYVPGTCHTSGTTTTTVLLYNTRLCGHINNYLRRFVTKESPTRPTTLYYARTSNSDGLEIRKKKLVPGWTGMYHEHDHHDVDHDQLTVDW